MQKGRALIGSPDRDWSRRCAHQWCRGEEMSEPLADDTWHSNCGMLGAPFLQYETFKCKWPPNAGALKKICAFAGLEVCRHKLPRRADTPDARSKMSLTLAQTRIKLATKPRASHKVCPHLLCQMSSLLPQDPLSKSRCTTSSQRIKYRNTFITIFQILLFLFISEPWLQHFAVSIYNLISFMWKTQDSHTALEMFDIPQWYESQRWNYQCAFLSKTQEWSTAKYFPPQYN